MYRSSLFASIFVQALKSHWVPLKTRLCKLRKVKFCALCLCGVFYGVLSFEESCSSKYYYTLKYLIEKCTSVTLKKTLQGKRFRKRHLKRHDAQNLSYELVCRSVKGRQAKLKQHHTWTFFRGLVGLCSLGRPSRPSQPFIAYLIKRHRSWAKLAAGKF